MKIPAGKISDIKKIPTKISLIYAFIGGLWILFSDMILGLFFEDPAAITRHQTIKGWFFIVITAFMLFVLLRNYIGLIRRSEEALRKSADEIFDLYNNAPCGYHSLDKDGVFVRVNDTELSWLGYSQEELIGKKKFTDIITPSGLKVFRNIFPELMERGWAKDLEFEIIRKDGSVIPVLVSSTAVKDDYGNFIMSRSTLFDITDLKRAEETIQYQTYHDTLTGLPNRALFMDRLSLEIPRMQNSQKKVAVLLLNIDRFKTINDWLGHAAGNMLIKDASTRLKANIREFDTIARIGGDEFTILLTGIAQPEDAIRAAEAAIKVFKEPFTADNQELRVTASIGISVSPDDGEDPEDLVKNAGIAMYYAKDQGGNSYQFFNSALNIRTVERILLENRLHNALDRGELVVYYQPLVDMKTYQITGAEALVRWKHPDLGLLNPTQFIPVAEEIGLVISIDQWVMRTACGQLKSWQKAECPIRYISVNLSALQFQQPNLGKNISGILEETGLSPESLGIEITETLAMQDTELTARNLNLLNAMGIVLSIDDFGTGYSSLSYLKKLPIHKLKIDQSFTRHLSNDADYQAIVGAVIAMAHILKLKVLAEGVETEEQMAFLKSRDCDEMQGFLYSEPLPAGEFEEMFAEKRCRLT
jgi:diguanylate cyclase (GGDEF)-like protein/PAS domain S-box-containing protein